MQAISKIFNVRERIAALIAVAVFSIGYIAMVALPTPVNAALEACDTASANIKNSAICKSRSENVGGSFGANLVNTMLFALGIVAVIMIIIGGIRYTTANGDASQITSAKNTILYSVVGLIVAIMAWGIVSFVVNQIGR